MRLIKPSFEILPTTGDIYKDIERVGRVCYKSEDKITDISAIPFVNMLMGRGHNAMLEHGTVYLSFKGREIVRVKGDYYMNNYSVVKAPPVSELADFTYYVTTNYRVLVENGWLDDLQYQCKPTEYHEKRVTVKFTCDRGVSHEFVRHKVFSFAQESTRYCNYSKDKFGNDITFIVPNWLDSLQLGEHDSHKICNEYYDIPLGQVFGAQELQELTYLWSLATTEIAYLTLIETGWQPQQARDVLPNSLKTELVMTGTIEQWKGFFKLRCDSAAHPQARELAIPLQEEFKRLGYVVE